MGNDQWDPGHGEPGHVHDENWNRDALKADDGTAVENEEGGKEAGGAGAGALACGRRDGRRWASGRGSRRRDRRGRGRCCR